MDAEADNLREAAFRASRKPSRGGLPNALFGALALANAPGELSGWADSLTVLLPWGSLLAAIARAEPNGLGALRGLCREEASVRFVFGYGAADTKAMETLRLPRFDDAATCSLIVTGYRDAGFDVRLHAVTRDEVRALGTSWAGKLAFGSSARGFLELRGVAR